MANSGSENKTCDDTLSLILFEAILDLFHFFENKNNFLSFLSDFSPSQPVMYGSVIYPDHLEFEHQ